jgi:UDP-N-acetyl-D-mannosaminuronic acid dehydrogenase
MPLMKPREFARDICVIGGGGHVGLPLAMTFADTGLRTVIYDINPQTVELIRKGIMPFAEEGGHEMLERVLATGTLEVESTPDLMSECEVLILIIGTPVDEHLNPSFTAIHNAIELCTEYLRDGQVLILRSTVYPGVSRHIQAHLKDKGLNVKVAFCPERVPQGYALREFREFPQIISAFDDETLVKVREVFGRFTVDFVEMEPMEAELTKLMTNAWRYIQFATVNQFYMIATLHGLDFNRILHGCRYRYPRMAGMPGPGFAAGPCLKKDTMQLAAFSQNHFVLGHSAMLINEGLPAHLIELARRDFGDLSKLTAGILGMAFKGDSDDRRDSLSYKLRKLLTLEVGELLCSDPYVLDANLVPQERVLAEADLIFIACPHTVYRGLKFRPDQMIIDVWNWVDRDAAPEPAVAGEAEKVKAQLVSTDGTVVGSGADSPALAGLRK